MNWNEYFKLREKQKRNRLKLIIVIVLINLFLIKGYLEEEPDYFCEVINVTCLDQDKEIELEEIVVNDSEINDSEDNVSDGLDIEEELNQSLVINESLNLSNNMTQMGVGEKIIKYSWLRCGNGCKLGVQDNLKIWQHRLFYSPLFIITDLALAYLVAFVIFLYSSFKLEHAKGEDEGDKEEKKEEKK